MKATFSEADRNALEAARAEYGFSTEPGGANAGDEDAEESYRTLSALSARIRVGEELELSQAEVEAIRHASWELGFSVEPGGAKEGSELAETQVRLLDELIHRAEHATF